MTPEELVIAKAKREDATAKAKATKAEGQRREQQRLGDSLVHKAKTIAGLKGTSSGRNITSDKVNDENSHDSGSILTSRPQQSELFYHKPSVMTSVIIKLAETNNPRYCHEVFTFTIQSNLTPSTLCI